jgi:outer membrane autotransporter protein
MKKNLRSKILLCVLAGGVLSANTALAATGENYVCGESFSSGQHEIKNKKVYAESTGGIQPYAVGVYAKDSYVSLDNVDITAKAAGDGTQVRVEAKGIYAHDNSNITITGGTINVEAKGSKDGKNDNAYAIYAWNGNVTINSNNIEINGDIYNDATEGLTSTIDIILNGKNAVINGNIQEAYGPNGSINVDLSNGAIWNINGNRSENIITDLILNNGIINRYDDNTSFDIEHYSGTGDINFKAQDTDDSGVLDFTNTGDVTIGTAEAGSSVNLGVINNTVNTLDIEKTEENLNAIAEKIVYVANDGNLGGKVTVKEGLITPEASGDLMFDGNKQGYVTNITGGDRVTKTMDAMKNLAATAIVAWRQEDSTLSQRLGELRESDGGQGIWVRMSRGEFEYDGEYKNQYNFFQMGYDWAAGNWHYGAAVSHNDGQTTYTHGDGENRSTSLSLYGTWLGDKGHYADIVLKQGRLSNDFDIYTEAGHTSGDYDAWGTSLSGEYGMKVDLDGGWYVTPQAQLTLMRIGGEDYTTNNGIKVNQDSLESAVGRIGFEVGKRISDSGSIYAKASLLHDFAGSADTYLSLNGLTNSYHQDIGDTWCEAGIGFNYKTSENSYVYADVVKTFGGDVETPWQWNAGMRWTF